MLSYVLILVASASLTQANVLITPTGIESNINPLWKARNLIDNSGLSDPFTTVEELGDTFHANVNTDNAYTTFDILPDYFENGGTVPVLTIDLGATYELTAIIIWGYTERYGLNEPKSFTLEFSTTGPDGVFSGKQTFESPEPLGTGAGSRPAQAALARVTANAVRLTVTDNFGGNRVGFGELKFVAAP